MSECIPMIDYRDEEIDEANKIVLEDGRCD